MNYKSHTSKGYTPKPSGPNMKGYYMGESSNLLNMMQVGGQATRGGAVLAQALQMQSDRDKLEKFQKSRIDAFEIYDSVYNRKLKKLWLVLIQEIYQDKSHKLKKRKFNEWEKMLLNKFGHKLVQIKEEKPI